MKKSFTRKLSALLSATAVALTFAGCSATSSTPNAETSSDSNSAGESVADTTNGASTSFSGAIAVVSREGGSGTRGAFIELVGVEQKDADGNKSDLTTEEALIANSTAVVLTQVSGNKNGIGYISLGSLNDTVKAVSIDGIEATVDNILAGGYKVSRPFNIATKGDVSPAAQDFINYILSKEGQQIVNDNKFIPINSNAEAFASNGAEGKVVVGGSSSVSPVLEKIAEAYKAVNPSAVVEIQTTDSSAGIKAVIDGTVDIGMASRELKDTESAEVQGTVIAMDGIAVIVNNENPNTNLTTENVKNIYIGTVTDWSEIG